MVSRWLWPVNRSFLEVASMVVTWWIVPFCVVTVSAKKKKKPKESCVIKISGNTNRGYNMAVIGGMVELRAPLKDVFIMNKNVYNMGTFRSIVCHVPVQRTCFYLPRFLSGTQWHYIILVLQLLIPVYRPHWYCKSTNFGGYKIWRFSK